jgi:DNA-binding protein Fis
MSQRTKPQPADSLLTELLPRIQAAPGACRDDLRTALTHAISVHDDALWSSGAQLGERSVDLCQVGVAWAAARHPLDPLLNLMSAVTEKMLDLGGPSREALVSETGGRIIRAILTGFQQAYQWAPSEMVAPHDRSLLAAALLWDLEVAPAHRSLLAESYAVMAFQHLKETDGELDMESMVARFLAEVPDALPFLAESLSYVLAPCPDRHHAAELAERFCQALPEGTSLAVAWRHREEVPSGRHEARDIVGIVASSERPPGVYQLNDVLVEYAVLREPSVANRLAKVLTPMADQPVLFSTLKSLIAADGNRSKAALDLGIHRSTLDYRLQRIEQLTGTDPASVGGLQLLSLAVTTYTALQFEMSGHDRPA